MIDIDWQILAQAGSFFGGIGAMAAILLALASYREHARLADANVLLTLLNATDRYAERMKAADIGDINALRPPFTDWLNHIEALAALCISRRLPKVTRSMIEPNLISCLARIQENRRFRMLRDEMISVPGAYEYLRAFERKFHTRIRSSPYRVQGIWKLGTVASVTTLEISVIRVQRGRMTFKPTVCAA